MFSSKQIINKSTCPPAQGKRKSAVGKELFISLAHDSIRASRCQTKPSGQITFIVNFKRFEERKNLWKFERIWQRIKKLQVLNMYLVLGWWSSVDFHEGILTGGWQTLEGSIQIGMEVVDNSPFILHKICISFFCFFQLFMVWLHMPHRNAILDALSWFFRDYLNYRKSEEKKNNFMDKSYGELSTTC